ncbi:MAG: PAS domain-containing protein, partial [Holophagaceae bacterium]|nr:PAS domain-containing protein [Holophagaceae bacterium]
MILALVAPPRGLSRFAWPLILLLAGLALTFGSWEQDRQDRRDRLRSTFETRSHAALSLIRVRLGFSEQALLGTRGLFAARGTVGSKEFAAYIASLRLEETHPGIQGIGFAKLVPAADKVRHLAEVRSQGFPEYQMRPEQNQAVYSTILHLEPFKNRNLRAFGYDMFTEPVRHEAMSRARDEGRTSMSGRVKLVQETDTEVQPGVLVYVPVYDAKEPSLTLEDRRKHLVGWVYAPFRMHDLMNGLLGEAESDLAIQLFDGAEARAETLLFDRGSALATASGSPLRTQHTLPFGGRTWTLVTQPLPPMLAKQGRDLSRAILAIGCLASLLAAGFAFFLMEQFHQLRVSNEALHKRSVERDEAREKAQDSELNYLTLSNSGEALIWTSGTDKLCNYFNLPWLAFTGRTLKQELGNGWVEGVHPDDLARCLDIYVRAFDRQEPFGMDYRLRHASGDYRWIIDKGTPRFDTGGAFLGYIGHCLDIS